MIFINKFKSLVLKPMGTTDDISGWRHLLYFLVKLKATRDSCLSSKIEQKNPTSSRWLQHLKKIK